MKKITILFFIPLFLFAEPDNKNYINWKYQTNAALFSHPVINDNIIYFGSNDNNLYAVNLTTQEAVWTFKTTNPIQSQVLINQDRLFFNNGDTVYSLDKRTGKLLWSYGTQDTIDASQLDGWDYHHGTPIINGTSIYFGMRNGIFYGFDLKTGNLRTKFKTINSAAIRCTPVIKNDVIYFGDWNGVVYAYNTALNDTIWAYKTYDEQPYPTFGQLNTEFVVYDSLLIFGGRNPELQVLNINTGKKVWNYISEEGGWISGDPIAKENILYIAGSDNHKLLTFNVHTGELYWEYEFQFNNFSKPLFYKDFIIFTTGDAYSQFVQDDGYGYLYALNINDGSIVNAILFDGNTYSTPVTDNQNLYITSEDGNLYVVDLNSFLYDPPKLSDIGYRAIKSIELLPNPFQDKLTISYDLNFPSTVNVKISDLQGNLIKYFRSEEQDKGQHTLKWDANDSAGKSVPDGYYSLETSTGIFYTRYFIQKVKDSK